MKPSVGRIVHFYSQDQAKHFNGQREGPYPAIITQVLGAYVNLKVFPPFAADYHQGSVSHLDDCSVLNWSRYWVWPPRE